MARPRGFEPLTHGLEGRCSIQLSYGRVMSGSFARNGRDQIMPSCRSHFNKTFISATIPFRDSPLPKSSDMKNGVADGARTRDNRNHNPVLYQLNYGHH